MHQAALLWVGGNKIIFQEIKLQCTEMFNVNKIVFKYLKKNLCLNYLEKNRICVQNKDTMKKIKYSNISPY